MSKTPRNPAGATASRPAGAGGLRGVQGGKQAEEPRKQRAETAFAPGEARLVGHRLAEDAADEDRSDVERLVGVGVIR